jgi:hypothetical protein
MAPVEYVRLGISSQSSLFKGGLIVVTDNTVAINIHMTLSTRSDPGHFLNEVSIGALSRKEIFSVNTFDQTQKQALLDPSEDTSYPQNARAFIVSQSPLKQIRNVKHIVSGPSYATHHALTITTEPASMCLSRYVS